MMILLSVFIFASSVIAKVEPDCVETWEQIRPHSIYDTFFSAKAWFRFGESQGDFGFNYRGLIANDGKFTEEEVLWKETINRHHKSTKEIPSFWRRTAVFYEKMILKPGIYEYQGFYKIEDEKREGNICPLLILKPDVEPIIACYDFKQYKRYDNESKCWCTVFSITLQRFKSNDSKLYLDFSDNSHPFFSLLVEDVKEHDGRWLTIKKEIPMNFFTKFLKKNKDIKVNLRIEGECKFLSSCYEEIIFFATMY